MTDRSRLCGVNPAFISAGLRSVTFTASAAARSLRAAFLVDAGRLPDGRRCLATRTSSADARCSAPWPRTYGR